MLESHTVDLNNISFHYAEAPGPGPALVIVHGLTGSHAEFLHLVPELARQAHVYLLDLRGHGQSSWTEEGYQVPDYGRDVTAFLRQVVGQPAILVGHSLGGLAATWLAAHAPDALLSLFLVDPAFYVTEMPRFGETAFYPYFAGLRRYLAQYRRNGAGLEKMVAYVGQTPVDSEHTLLDVAGPEAVQERATQLHQVDPAVLDPALAGNLFGSAELDDLLAQIRCPVHMLAAQSALGGAMEAQDVQRAIRQMPHCTHAVIENAGHDIHLDQPEAFIRELKQFLTSIQGEAYR